MLTKEDLQAIQELIKNETKESENRIFTYIESNIETKINLLVEGHQTIIETLETLTPKTKYEELQEEVDFLKDVVKMLTKEVKELKAG